LIAFVASTHAPKAFSPFLVHIIVRIDCIHCIRTGISAILANPRAHNPCCFGTSSLGTAGGTAVTITGSGFTDADDVTFGGVEAASFDVIGDGVIAAVSPPMPAGVWDVTVITPAGTSAFVSADRVTLTAASAPAVSGLGTSSGSTAGGTLVTVSGSGFTAADAVLFGAVPATNFTVISDTSVTAIASAQAAGTVDVTIVGPTGNSVVGSSDQFTYSAASSPTVTGLSPTSGSVNGGTVVTITGTNFTAATAVTFGSLAAASFTVVSGTTILATEPAKTSTGNVYVTVTTAGGTSSTGSASQFDNTTGTTPSITALSPSSGPVGGGNTVTFTGVGFTGASQVTYAGGQLSATSGPTGGGTFVSVTGSNFTTATFVKFGIGYASSYTILSDTQLTAIAPFAMGAGTVDVTVVNGGGTSATSSAPRATAGTRACRTPLSRTT